MSLFPNAVAFTGALACIALLAGAPDAMAQAQLHPQITAQTAPNTYQVTWPGITGRLYFVELSSDLQTWNFAPDVLLGDGTNLGYGFSSTTSRFYLRLRYSTATGYTQGAGGDFDGDGISNLQEITVYGYDPTVNDDPDNDGVYTAVEETEGTSAVSSDTDGDGESDGAERAAGRNPRIYDHPETKLSYLWRSGAASDRYANCTVPGQQSQAPHRLKSTTSAHWHLQAKSSSSDTPGPGGDMENPYNLIQSYWGASPSHGLGWTVHGTPPQRSILSSEPVWSRYSAWRRKSSLGFYDTSLPEANQSDLNFDYWTGDAYEMRVRLKIETARSRDVRRTFLYVDRQRTGYPAAAPWSTVAAGAVTFVITAGQTQSPAMPEATTLALGSFPAGEILQLAPPTANLPGAATAQIADRERTLVPAEVLTDHNRDGKLDLADLRPEHFADQGAYGTDEKMRPDGAIVWANLDYEEERLVGSGDLRPDTIRFWHNGIAFESSDEDFVIRNGERTIEPYLPGYTPYGGEVRSPCPDIAPILIPRMQALPKDCRVLLRVARAEDLKAFHLYKRIPDFSQSDPEETAIWGKFGTNAPWDAGGNVVDDRTIDLTRWINEQSVIYEGHTAARRVETDPFVFGIEAMLYKGMRYGFSAGSAGQTFDGNVDFSLILQGTQGGTTKESLLSRFRLTFLRLPAFPGAQGFGRWAEGGRGGEVYIVKNLHDSGPDSLRQGIENRVTLPLVDFPGTERKKPRTIVFETGGRIELGQTKKLSIGRGRLTIAGQSAPGAGITIKNATFQVSGTANATGKNVGKPNDVIIRYLRARRATSVPAGKDPNSSDDYPMGPDVFEIRSASRVIVDHCSFSGGIDGSLDIIPTDEQTRDQPEMDVTAQWCFIHHTLDPHSKASLLRGKHGARYSILNNYYGHNGHRNPEIGWLNVDSNDMRKLLVEFSNNTVYNWGGSSNSNNHAGITQTDSKELRLQFIGNYYKPGNDTDDPLLALQIQSPNDTIYFDANTMRGGLWAGAYQYVGTGVETAIRSGRLVTEQTTELGALTARDRIHLHGGCSRQRDIADLAYINEIPPGTETPKYEIVGTIPSALISSYDVQPADPGAADADADGMADAWETRFFAPSGDAIPWKDADGDGWTNLEEYLNRTSPLAVTDPCAESESQIEGPLHTP